MQVSYNYYYFFFDSQHSWEQIKRKKTCSDMVRVTLHLAGLTQSSYHDMNVTCKFFIIRMM